MRFIHLLCLVGFLSASACDQHDSEPSAQPKSQEPASTIAKHSVSLRPDSLPYVTIKEIQPEAFAGTISAPARVDFRSQAISTAGTVVAGRVTKVYVQIGDRVKAGAPLATLTSAEAAQMRSDYARAAAEVGRAEDRRRRQLEMQRTGVGLEIERVEAETQLKQARTELERSLDFLRLLGDGAAGEVIIRAPMDSMVLKAHVSTGAAVEPGSPLFDLGEPSAAWIIADVFEKDLLLVEKGAKVVIELASLPEPIQGHVVGESAAIQTDLRRASVFIEADDPKIPLRPGMYARVSIEASTPNRIILPTAAILIKDGRETVVYVETAPNTFESRPVQVGQARSGMTPVLKGLSGGERVVVGGALLLDGEASLLL
ncbi:efflux RND transporter periplasmic adaptor subunit [Methylomonas koyamae]|uniref:Efflux transporter periplasmic adaptor subunit n=1 Tax=Methylomonas koyamae TaxID=702114 RepID=A0A177NKM7_9GAMM|nr:efflux RND transporter periplasmic adaptor subunit [Methylomonas koyamae]OAI17580.1 efflux transporter periplasmic adaptor subunit [Methylomonas koyamae]